MIQDGTTLVCSFCHKAREGNSIV